MKLDPPINIKLDDDKSEQARRDLVERLVKVQSQPFVRAEIVADVELADGKTTPVPHKLGQRPVFVGISVVRGAASAGYINEISRDATYVKLQANGFGATVKVDLELT